MAECNKAINYDIPAAISVQSVNFSYEDGKAVLRDVSLTVNAGEMVALVGANGSGKSTLAKLICGFFLPDSGIVNVFGNRVSSGEAEAIYAARREMGFVQQNPDDAMVATFVEDEVAFGPENLGLPSTEIRERVSEALQETQLAGFERREVNSLSGGQKQRCAVAGALAMRPRLLVLDEATSMLDPVGRQSLISLIKKLNEQGCAVLAITHYMEEAAQADRIIALNGKGEVALDGTPNYVLAQTKELKQLGLVMERHVEPVHSKFSEKNSEQAPEQPLINFENVSFRYPESKEDELALEDINLCVHRSELLAIVGPTGSGKSTLVQHMNGLLQPTAGNVTVCAHSTNTKQGRNNARSKVGFAFQYPERQLFAPTVFDDVAYGLRNAGGLTNSEIEQRVLKALEQVGLDAEAIASSNPFALSGGQARRVAIAGVLATGPEVLVLDEPCAGLDPRAHGEFLDLIATLNNSGTTIVMVTHDMEDASTMASRIIEMREGKICENYSNL